MLPIPVSLQRWSKRKKKPVRFYTPSQVDDVLQAYHRLFPRMTPALRAYWDHARERPWSCITTDFKSASYEQFEQLHRSAVDIDARGLTAPEEGAALAAAAREAGVGYSLGICPWTDNGLLETYSTDKTCLVIIVAHDWYPIVPVKEHPVGTPLLVEGLHYTPKYWKGGPQDVFSPSSVLLFLNLYPDYRHPGDTRTGRIATDYSLWLQGFMEAVDMAASTYDEVALISWGAPVWETLRSRVDVAHQHRGIMLQAEEASGTRLVFQTPGRAIPYLPLAHPSYARNFNQPHHLAHVRAGFANLGLGGPGRR